MVSAAHYQRDQTLESEPCRRHAIGVLRLLRIEPLVQCAESGIIATMLVGELRRFAEAHPATCRKLLKTLVVSALRKQNANIIAARRTRVGTPPAFRAHTPDEEVDPSAPAILRKLLEDKGFVEEEVWARAPLHTQIVCARARRPYPLSSCALSFFPLMARPTRMVCCACSA